MVPKPRDRHRVSILRNAGAAMDPPVHSNVGGFDKQR
jgi:hypothetical protein